MKETGDEFQRKSSELRMAVASFVESFPADRKGVVAGVAAMAGELDGLDESWREYRSADPTALGRLHSRLRAKMEMLKSSLDESVRLCGSSSRYAESHGYVARKLDELRACLPARPRRARKKGPEQMTLDGMLFDEPSNGERPPVPSPVLAEPKTDPGDDGQDEKAVSDEFLRRLNELNVAIGGFVQSYSKEEGRTSVVGYVRDISSVYLAPMLNLWRSYMRDSNQDRVNSSYQSMSRNLDTISKYLDMSVMISRSCGKEKRYAENQAYIGRKIGECLACFPKEPRKVRTKDDDRPVRWLETKA